MRVVVKERYKEELNFEICSNIVKKLNIQEDFEIQHVKGNGRYVLIEYKDVRYYIIVSRKDAGQSRDAFLNEYIPTVLKQYIDDVLNEYNTPDPDICFVTHSTIEPEIAEEIKAYVESKNIFKNVVITVASATITSHCGKGTLGILFINDGGKV